MSEAGSVPPAGGSFFEKLASQRRFVLLVVALLSIAGVWAAFLLPSAIYPELQFSRVTVVVEGGSLGARQVLFSVTRPIEEAVSSVPGVLRVRSRSIRGGSEINITFSPQTEMTFALQQVQAQVNQVRGDLPAGLDIQVERLTPSLFPILNYNLEGGDPATLYDIARYQVKPLFSRVPGVGRVDIMGSESREIEVIADPSRLAAQGMTWDDLAGAIRDAITVTAVGRTVANYRGYLIVTATEAKSAEDVGNVMVGHGLRVRDLATVLPGTTDHVRIISGDGKPAALINVARQPGGNTLDIADSITSLTKALAATLPPGVHLVPVYDQATLVRDAVISVRDAMLIGAGLAVLILLFFLGDLRVTAISASAIPLTMVITVFIMQQLGQTYNLMTLGAMAIAIGLVIDNAVVVAENIVRKLPLSSDRTQAIAMAVQELLWPVTTSTITTVVVFLPLGLLTGVEGQFFKALSITLSIAVLVSLFLALTLIPLLSERWLSAEQVDETKASRGIARRISNFADGYARSLARVIPHPRWVIAIAVLLLVGGIVVERHVGTGFLPEMDEGAFVLDYWTPGGTALAESDRQLHIIEKILGDTPEIVSTSRRTGAELGLFATLQNRGDLIARLKPIKGHERSTAEVIDEVRGKIETAVPGVRIEFVQILSDVINDLAGAARPVEIKLFGPDLTALEAYGKQLGKQLASIDGLEDVYNGVSEPTSELLMHVNTAAANRAGLTPAQVSQAVSGAFLGVDAGQIRAEDRAIDVRVRAPDDVRSDVRGLALLPVKSPTRPMPIALGSLATFEKVDTRAELYRENQQQTISITADLTTRTLGDVMTDVRSVLKSLPPPAGIRLELAGQYAGQQAAFRALLLVLSLASISVVAVMVVQFQSFVEPLVILLAAPLSFGGALLLLMLTGTPLNVSSFMGLILLVGLIVKNGIILLDFTRHRMLEGHLPLDQAVCEAARIRLRPILMTTLCTLFGLLPLALALGAGSELQRPLALAVVGGLAISTPITLYLIPTLLVAIRGRGYTMEKRVSS